MQAINWNLNSNEKFMKKDNHIGFSFNYKLMNLFMPNFHKFVESKMTESPKFGIKLSGHTNIQSQMR